jgi:NitT/TauT family transport system substrate-binding protein
MTQTRRRVLRTLAATGAASLIRLPRGQAGEAPLETTSVRLAKIPGICIAPQYVAEELLREEGFADVRYVAASTGVGQSDAIANGSVDFSLNFAAPLIIPMDAGAPITVVAGVHVGCFELFTHEGIDRITDLKGRSVGVQGLGTSPHVFLAAMAAHVGLDPIKDIHWIISTDPSVKPTELFAERKIDAFLGFPPEPQELRARHIGHVIVTARSIVLGRNISATCSRVIASSFAKIRLPPSAFCVPSSRPRTFASPIPPLSRAASSRAASLLHTTMPFRR